MILPLTELNEIELIGGDEIITGWLDNDTLKLKGVKREKGMQKFDKGSFKMKTISEMPIEREVKALKDNNIE